MAAGESVSKLPSQGQKFGIGNRLVNPVPLGYKSSPEISRLFPVSLVPSALSGSTVVIVAAAAIVIAAVVFVPGVRHP